MEEDMSSKMNESILIETSNRINSHESRMFQKDIAIYEHEVKDMKENLRVARLDLSAEVSKRIEALMEKDQKITQLGSEVSAAKFEISVLETRLAKSRQDCEEARSRNRTLSMEVASLKISLAECKEELRRGIEAVKDQKENMTKREIEQVADIQHKIGELTATNKHLEEKVMEYEEKENTLAKQLAEAQGNAEAAKAELVELQKKLVEIEGSSSLTHQYLLEESNKLSSSQQQQSEMSVEQNINRELREELKKAEAKAMELTQMMEIVDAQCEQYRELKMRADVTRQKALDECSQMATKLRETERELERQRSSEVEVNQLRAEKDRLEMKIRYLNIDELNTKLAQMESTSRSVKRQLEELKLDNEKLQEQTKLEDEIMNLEETLREKEKLEAYLQSQVKAKDMPKLSRRSTLLRTPSESSVEVIDPVIVEELENEKTTLLKELEEKKKGENPFRGQPSREHGKYAVEIAVLMSRKMMPPPLPKDRLRQPSPIYSNPYSVTPTRNPMAGLQSKSVADIRYSQPQKKLSTLAPPTPQKAIMRHDIPHRWTELRHFGLFSIKCAVCFIGVPTFAKKKRCAHCGIIVHSQCSKRVVNTCGLPDQCANYYLDAYNLPNGRMNGWVRLFRDDSNVREWQSAWGEMDEKRLAFYDNDSVQTDLRKPFLSVIDDYLLIGAQSGLFFTNINSARVPVRIGGFNSVTAMECLTDLNILALIIDHKRSLALIPLPALKLALNVLHPSVRADVISGYDHLHAISYHHQDGQRYLCAASSAKIHVLKYNQARDVFTGHQLSRGQLEPVRLVESSVADYPIALLQIREDEVLLAYQMFTAPYLYVVHYDSIEILQVAEYTGQDSG
ncbi:CNH domain protein [Teladorsagia circumcincta]|uniref:CNH domain protein n=1 Tax=Teladorsagia circumcincta TaxID=45464 RepID=A0A2G9V153_TELCI|nr:CNH domain protein [Teladorsagia circumcincta]